LQIHTSINESLMNGLYHAVNQEKLLMKQMNGGVAPPRWLRISAVLEKPGTGQIVAFYGGPGQGVKHCQAVACQFNTVLSAQQVGSSFKPYVLATAVSQGMNAQTSILNSHSPLCIPPADKGFTYQVQLSKQTLTNCNTPAGFYALNQPGENYRQSLAVPAATALSSNPAYEDLIHRTSVYAVIDMASRLGVSPTTVQGLSQMFGPNGKFPGSVTAALGQGQLTPVDQANTFSTLVSGGMSAAPHLITSVYEGGTKLPVPAVLLPRQAVTPVQAADTDYALSFDTRLPGATGVPNAVWNRPMMAKTGTLGTGTNSSQAWFIGAIPQYAMSVALFADQPAHQFLDVLPTIGGWTGGYGGAWPAHIWHTFMSSEFNNLQVQQLPTPNFGAPFTKWVQVQQAPPKKCQQQQQQGGQWWNGGGGNQQGHGHHKHGIFLAAQFGPKPCQSQSPNPSPGPSSTSPSPSPSPSNSGSPSPSPSPSPSWTLGAQAANPGRAPGQQPVWRPRWAPVPTGLW